LQNQAVKSFSLCTYVVQDVPMCKAFPARTERA